MGIARRGVQELAIQTPGDKFVCSQGIIANRLSLLLVFQNLGIETFFEISTHNR